MLQVVHPRGVEAAAHDPALDALGRNGPLVVVVDGVLVPVQLQLELRQVLEAPEDLERLRPVGVDVDAGQLLEHAEAEVQLLQVCGEVLA